MRAFTLDSFERPPGPREDLPTPQLGDDQLLVRVQASSVNPVDTFIAAGVLKAMAEHEFPVALGRDYAGVIGQAGPAVTGYAPGDEVYGWLPHANPTVHEGSWAELIAVPQGGSVARRPASVDVRQAGAAPLAALTALAASDALELGEGATVLVVGASGGVGSFAVQLAAAAGATVLAPGLPEDTDYLRSLGAAEVLDRNGDLVAAVRGRYPDGVDALLDLVSSDPEALNAYAALVRDGGRIASSVGAAGQGPGRTNVSALPGRENLERLAGLLADGTLSVPIQASYPLAPGRPGPQGPDRPAHPGQARHHPRLIRRAAKPIAGDRRGSALARRYAARRAERPTRVTGPSGRPGVKLEPPQPRAATGPSAAAGVAARRNELDAGACRAGWYSAG